MMTSREGHVTLSHDRVAGLSSDSAHVVLVACHLDVPLVAPTITPTVNEQTTHTELNAPYFVKLTYPHTPTGIKTNVTKI